LQAFQLSQRAIKVPVEARLAAEQAIERWRIGHAAALNFMRLANLPYLCSPLGVEAKTFCKYL